MDLSDKRPEFLEYLKCLEERRCNERDEADLARENWRHGIDAASVCRECGGWGVCPQCKRRDYVMLGGKRYACPRCNGHCGRMSCTRGENNTAYAWIDDVESGSGGTILLQDRLQPVPAQRFASDTGIDPATCIALIGGVILAQLLYWRWEWLGVGVGLNLAIPVVYVLAKVGVFKHVWKVVLVFAIPILFLSVSNYLHHLYLITPR